MTVTLLTVQTLTASGTGITTFLPYPHPHTSLPKISSDLHELQKWFWAVRGGQLLRLLHTTYATAVSPDGDDDDEGQEENEDDDGADGRDDPEQVDSELVDVRLDHRAAAQRSRHGPRRRRRQLLYRVDRVRRRYVTLYTSTIHQRWNRVTGHRVTGSATAILAGSGRVTDQCVRPGV